MLRLRSKTLLLKLAVFEGMKRGDRSGFCHGSASFGLNPREIQWSISVALCFPRAVHCFFGQIKYCNSLMSQRSPIKFKESSMQSCALPSWRHFPLWYFSSSLTPHHLSRGWITRLSHLPGRSSGISSPWQEKRSWKPWELLSVSAFTPCAGAGHGFQRAESALAGAHGCTAPASKCPRLQGEPVVLTPESWDPPGNLLNSPSNMMSGNR